MEVNRNLDTPWWTLRIALGLVAEGVQLDHLAVQGAQELLGRAAGHELGVGDQVLAVALPVKRLLHPEELVEARVCEQHRAIRRP